MLALLFFFFTTLNQPDQDLEIRLGIDDTIKTRWPESFLSITNNSSEEIKIVSRKWIYENEVGVKDDLFMQMVSLDEKNNEVDFWSLKPKQEYYISFSLHRIYPHKFRGKESFIASSSPLKEGNNKISVIINYIKNNQSKELSKTISFLVKYPTTIPEQSAAKELNELDNYAKENKIGWEAFLKSESKNINSFLTKNKNTDAANYLSLALIEVLNDITDYELLNTLQNYYETMIENHPDVFIRYFRFYIQNKDNPSLSTVISRFDKLVKNNKAKIFNPNDFNFIIQKRLMSPGDFELLNTLAKD